MILLEHMRQMRFFEANTTHQTERQCFPPAYRLRSCVDPAPRGG